MQQEAEAQRRAAVAGKNIAQVRAAEEKEAREREEKKRADVAAKKTAGSARVTIELNNAEIQRAVGDQGSLERAEKKRADAAAKKKAETAKASHAEKKNKREIGATKELKAAEMRRALRDADSAADRTTARESLC